ncbi:hypothetical protein FAI40_10025 [Acetobacteraceae bacterium]|nr:hypothetical protein FAI40_10025 [Acetobacteraceae bacterium]
MTTNYVLPISKVPSQKVQSLLLGKKTMLWIRQLASGIYCDIWVENTLIAAGVLCLNKTWMLRDKTFSINGDFVFLDTQGNTDPTLNGLGDRYQLIFRSFQ